AITTPSTGNTTPSSKVTHTYTHTLTLSHSRSLSLSLCGTVTVRLPVTVAVMHSGAKTHTGDNADYMHTVYLNTNNHHTSPRSVPHIGHTTTKHTGTESVWRVDFQMQY